MTVFRKRSHCHSLPGVGLVPRRAANPVGHVAPPPEPTATAKPPAPPPPRRRRLDSRACPKTSYVAEALDHFEQGAAAPDVLLRTRFVSDSRYARSSLTTNAKGLSAGPVCVTIVATPTSAVAGIQFESRRARAAAVKSYLEQLGRAGVECVVSTGNETPFARNQRSCWQQNVAVTSNPANDTTAK